MSYVIFVAPESTSQADTIIVGPYKSYGKAVSDMTRIERLYGETVACMVMDCLPSTDIGVMFR